MLVPIIDDAHLMDIECLRRLRLLFEDFPKCHNLVLVAQNPLIDKLRLGVNEDIRSRVTYSVTMPRLAPEDVRAFIFGQFDRVSLAHSAFSDEVLGLDAPVVVKEHYWTCPDTGEAGNAIDFMMRFRGLSFAEAMDLLA